MPPGAMEECFFAARTQDDGRAVGNMYGGRELAVQCAYATANIVGCVMQGTAVKKKPKKKLWQFESADAIFDNHRMGRILGMWY